MFYVLGSMIPVEELLAVGWLRSRREAGIQEQGCGRCVESSTRLSILGVVSPTTTCCPYSVFVNP